VATVTVQLLAPATSTVTANPVDIFSDGGSHLTQITISGLLDADGLTPVPDGAKVGLSASYCAARYSSGYCVNSAGGQILSGGNSAGDGTPLSGNSTYSVFTVAGGKVVAAYADQGIASSANQTQVATVQVEPLNSAGTSVLSTTEIGVGSVNLRGASSATATGPTTLSISAGGTGTLTFSGIKDAAGNTVPDGTIILVSTANCATRNSSGYCVSSTGGTLSGGTPSTWSSSYQEFTVTNGSITVTYSATGASVGTASVQLLPSQPNGTGIGNTVLNGGIWAITITN
jgi:hypothetical protein